MKNNGLATKTDLRKLDAKVAHGFEQIVATSAAALKLTQQELRALRVRVTQLERKTRRRR